MNIGWTEILVILLIILLLFGAKRLPDLARSLGKSLREFKKGRDESGRDEGAPGPKKDNDQTGGG
ncbi:MAG: twin-arginine translocase TatA/TatE family subunit [Kiritimatiellae bacterium]|nr:twin-arginine translocase TatA/TatE family subunit [Kiritimatiellia bacterium]